MKKDTPEYRPVVFFDTQSDQKFLIHSTISSSETIQWEDNQTYPLVKVEISAYSHPHYTGKKVLVDTAGRVEHFRKKYAKNK